MNDPQALVIVELAARLEHAERQFALARAHWENETQKIALDRDRAREELTHPADGGPNRSELLYALREAEIANGNCQQRIVKLEEAIREGLRQVQDARNNSPGPNSYLVTAESALRAALK